MWIITNDQTHICLLLLSSASAHYRVEDGAGHRRYIKHLQHGSADIERSESPESI